jgi:hypothetical protein
MEKYSELQRYRDAVKALDRSRSKYDTKKSYSSFWMDDKSNRFTGLGDDIRSTNDTAKLIKLGNYQRAIANFVKIVTQREIPVTFKGDTSFTDGQAVNLTTDIKDNNFDVIVGLALHEGSHIVLSDFELLKELRESNEPVAVKDILNWIEDRRIDQYIFSTSPGYRAYYHKMYDYYWNDKIITKAMLARKYRTVEFNSYMFQLVNMLNPAFQANALPGLQEIVNLIDVNNIARLQSTSEALEIARGVWSIIERELNNPDNEQPEPESGPGQDGSSAGSNQPMAGSQGSSANDENSESKAGQSAGSNQSQGDSAGDDEESLEDDGSTAQGEDSDDAGSGNSNGDEELPELTPEEERDLKNAINKQKDFMNGNVDKKSATSKKMVSQIQSLLKGGVDMQACNVSGKVLNTLIYDYSSKTYALEYLAISEQRNASEDSTVRSDLYNRMTELRNEYGLFVDLFSSRKQYKDAVKEGVELGGILGRKLQIRGESRTLEFNRLTSGRIDNKRLAHAGYGIETVFNQIHVDSYKRANLHISLDASGSMSGDNWASALRMTAAICKAATYVQNVDVQVSVRGTSYHSSGRSTESPVLVYLYNSRKNSFNHLITLLNNIGIFGCTPEGICFEALIRKNLLTPTSGAVDSYFLNVSDGMPEMSNYSGNAARSHTRKQVENLRNRLNIGVMSFFVSNHVVDENNSSYRYFREMYGKDSQAVNSRNMTELARAMNQKFLSHGKVSS